MPTPQSFDDAFQAALPRLVTAYHQGRLVPFVGLGMSRPLCADWRGLIENLEALALHEGLLPPGDVRGAKEKVGADTELPQRANRAVAVLRRGSKRPFADLMREALYPTGNLPPGKMSERGIVPQSAALGSILRWPLVLTTNYDDFLYRDLCFEPDAEQKWKGPLVLGRSPADCVRVVASLTSPAPRILWTLQGFLPFDKTYYNPPEGDARGAELAEQMVVGHEEYRRVTHRIPWFRRAFAEVFRARSFLFLGSGLKDQYLMELFGEAIEMCGPSPFPHFALIRRGELDPRFMLNRYHVVVIEYDDHKDVTGGITRLKEALDADGIRPRSHGFSFRAPADAGSDSRPPDLEVVRGWLPPLGPGECVGVSCGLRGPEGEPEKCEAVPGTKSLEYLNAAGVSHDKREWVKAAGGEDASAGLLARFADAAGQPSPYYGLIARTGPGGKRDSRVIPGVCKRFLSEAQAQGFRVARLQLVAGGSWAPYDPLHAAAQLARGVKEWFLETDKPSIRVVVHIVNKDIWFNIQSGRLDLLELLRCDDMRVVVVTNVDDGPVGVAENAAVRQFRVIGPAATAQEVADTADVPHAGWMFEVYPSPTKTKFVHPLDSAEAKERLTDLGAVPGSTIRFFRTPAQPGAS